MTRGGVRRRLAKALIPASATAVLALWAFPIFWAIVVALKSESEVLAFPPSLVFKPTLANFGDSLVGRFSILPEMWTSLCRPASFSDFMCLRPKCCRRSGW